MPELSEIEYSRDATIAAFRNYYQFLTKMYFKDSDVIEPPEDGWPTITPEILKGINKDDEVIELFRYLFYTREIGSDSLDVAPWAKMFDWQGACESLAAGKHATVAEAYKLLTEGEYEGNVLSLVIGITDVKLCVECFLLDVEQGAIYWPGCNSKIEADCTVPGIVDDLYDYCENEEEAEWRGLTCWAIPDFFEVLKEQFQKLNFIPISTETVIATYGRTGPLWEKDMGPILQQIYRDHGWPNLNEYRKEECLKAVQKALVEHYPDRADYSQLNEEEAKDLDARIEAAHAKRYP
ncbi:hypothetical protein B0O99DRAFT_640883 [Bisporella sp. PMI_857]|nr:hypothetical protein B0O99DRAFT_640883 [Bisporella sp. PMI_857]